MHLPPLFFACRACATNDTADTKPLPPSLNLLRPRSDTTV